MYKLSFHTYINIVTRLKTRRPILCIPRTYDLEASELTPSLCIQLSPRARPIREKIRDKENYIDT